MAEKRGQLSSLDLLPEDAQGDLVWAIGELNQRRRTQADILFEFNDRLAVKGIDPISRSAFNRASVRLASRASRIEERRRVYASIAEKLTPDEVAQADLVLGEFLKTLIDELLDEGEIGTKGAMELARAYQSTIAAQKVSAERRRAIEAETKAKLIKAVDAVEGAISKSDSPASKTGLTGDLIGRIRAELGIDKPSGETP